ncbi:Fur family transcriptional regulator, zinc uptake regulator [Arboricoccus pini]|uniref:Ferric uptake regulation protein n=1 Tax=Arboricoccus pini TaxID=1963835 RepID=A0A212Q798_9PROT|nr:Fur family transcriptional regulator, zinc uptake regulator [Arboricoccus pini]
MALDDPFLSASHDHDHCIETALGRAVAICAHQGARLTALRRRVLELVWSSHAPIGAYQIMEMMRGERSRVAPPTVYRALDFLADNGLIHRLDTLNAFIGCSRPGVGHKAYFLICRHCGNAVEFADTALDAAIADASHRAGFAIEVETVELRGLCAACRPLSANS